MMSTDRQERVSADEIAEKAMTGEDISHYFSNKGEMKSAVHKIHVDISSDMLQELDAFATELNVSRQAVIKVYLRQSLDYHYLARDRRGASEIVKNQISSPAVVAPQCEKKD